MVGALQTEMEQLEGAARLVVTSLQMAAREENRLADSAENLKLALEGLAGQTVAEVAVVAMSRDTGFLGEVAEAELKCRMQMEQMVPDPAAEEDAEIRLQPENRILAEVVEAVPTALPAVSVPVSSSSPGNGGLQL